MSATLGTLLTRLDPSLKITMVERLDHVAHESTDGWNNAGTGHAGYCELNYTPEDAQGNVSIDRALTINANFEVSLQFWTHLVETGGLPEPSRFINTTPHLSFVWGEANVAFLRQRYEKLSAHHLFKDMEYSEDPAVLREWMPLVMNGRDPAEKVAATRVAYGADVDFGSLTRNMVARLQDNPHFSLLLNHEVDDFDHADDGSWFIEVADRNSGDKQTINARFVFLGAGGGALPLLQASGIDEANGYGGFPVSGQWLVCKDQSIVSQHHAKVYGKGRHWGATDVGTTPGYPYHQWPAGLVIRTLCRVYYQVPESRFQTGPAEIGEHQQPDSDDVGRYQQHGSDQVPDR